MQQPSNTVIAINTKMTSKRLKLTEIVKHSRITVEIDTGNDDGKAQP
jgi:hypothetical protein